jgi:2,4-dienoyl-CoA reductase-like NADH-dependent reductase (Old Yellow Enzyme family)/NADPH-dependent 2,4-dienoyl-CoA reductase/sulfur reductase-like enzyme
MAREGFQRLFEPGRVGTMETANRLVLASMDDNMADREGRVSDQKIAWFRRKAQGGVGWIQTGYVYVTRRGRGCTYFQMGIYDDAFVPGLRRLTEAVHEYNVRIGIQIAHAGRQTTHHYLNGLQPEAPSPVPEPLLGERPAELSKERIGEIHQEFVRAAERGREAGFDLVEIHGAHGYLHHSFVSPLSNLRTDEYGGTLENRARFSVESVRALRAALGPDFTLGYRISCDEFVEGGFTIDDVCRVVPLLEDAGIDYINVSGGSYESVKMMIAPAGIGPGQLEPYAARLKQVARVPVLSSGRYNSPELAERVLEAGSADFVVVGRALIADPDFPKKAKAGRIEDIRPCVACEQGCIDRWFSALDITCVGNPEAGRESLEGWETIGHREPTGCRVLVVGGGPAGLEAARTSSLLGHDLTLWEAQESLGGQLALAARAPHQHEWGELHRWLVRQVKELGVELVLGRRADSESVLGQGIDAVILATGARPAPPRWVSGWDAPNVADPFVVLAGEIDVGRRVVVIGGDTIGCRTAHFLAEAGHEVTLVGGGRAGLFDEDDADFAFDLVGEIVRPMLIEWLRETVTLIAKRHPKRVVEDGVVLDLAGAFPPFVEATRIGPVDEMFLPADTVVLGTQRRPQDELYDGLRGHLDEVYLVGDALHPRTVAEATTEGSGAARSIATSAKLLTAAR